MFLTVHLPLLFCPIISLFLHPILHHNLSSQIIPMFHLVNLNICHPPQLFLLNRMILYLSNLITTQIPIRILLLYLFPLFYFITASLPHGTAPDSHYHLNCSSLSFSLCVFFKKFESSCGDFPFSATGWWARFFHSPGSFFLLYLHVGFRHLVQV